MNRDHWQVGDISRRRGARARARMRRDLQRWVLMGRSDLRAAAARLLRPRRGGGGPERARATGPRRLPPARLPHSLTHALTLAHARGRRAGVAAACRARRGRRARRARAPNARVAGSCGSLQEDRRARVEGAPHARARRRALRRVGPAGGGGGGGARTRGARAPELQSGHANAPFCASRARALADHPEHADAQGESPPRHH